MKWLAAFISCMLLSAPALAREINPAERREEPFDASLPACADPSVLRDISSRFSHKEGRFWNSDLKLIGFERVQEVAWRPWGLDYIPRRFCTATVWISDGRKTRVDYSVREDLGMISMTWGVEFCVHGLDRNWAFNPACKMARP
jgi:hypothetical protein